MSDPTTAALDRAARVRALVDQLRSAAERAIQRMAAELIDRPDGEVFGDVEYRPREAAPELAATAHQTGLEAREKGIRRVVPGLSGVPGGCPVPFLAGTPDADRQRPGRPVPGVLPLPRVSRRWMPGG